MKTNIKNNDDTVIDFIGMNYLSSILEILKVFAPEESELQKLLVNKNIIEINGLAKDTEDFLNLLMNKNVSDLYDLMLSEGFTEIQYDSLELEYSDIDMLIYTYKANTNILHLIKNDEEHDMDFYHDTLQYSTESYLDNKLLEYLDFAKSKNISFLELTNLFKIATEINTLECIFNIALINEYKIDIESIINFKKLYPLKTGDYVILYENSLNLPGVSTILTPIYKYNNIETYIDIEYNFEEYKFNKDVLTPTGTEVYTQTFFNLITDKINSINYNVSKLPDEYQKHIKNKSLKTLVNQIDKYLIDRVKEISDSILSCTNIENLRYRINKIPLFCFQNDNLILEKMEYTQYQVNKLLKEYNAVSSS